MEENIGITALSRYLVEDQVMKGRLREIYIQGLNMESYYYVIHHRNKVITPELPKIKDLIIAWIKESAEDSRTVQA